MTILIIFFTNLILIPGLKQKVDARNKLIDEKIFTRFVLLSMRNGPGTIEGVYNENFSRLRN